MRLRPELALDQLGIEHRPCASPRRAGSCSAARCCRRPARTLRAGRRPSYRATLYGPRGPPAAAQRPDDVVERERKCVPALYVPKDRRALAAARRSRKIADRPAFSSRSPGAAHRRSRTGGRCDACRGCGSTGAPRRTTASAMPVGGRDGTASVPWQARRTRRSRRRRTRRRWPGARCRAEDVDRAKPR